MIYPCWWVWKSIKWCCTFSANLRINRDTRWSWRNRSQSNNFLFLRRVVHTFFIFIHFVLQSCLFSLKLICILWLIVFKLCWWCSILLLSCRCWLWWVTLKWFMTDTRRLISDLCIRHTQWNFWNIWLSYLFIWYWILNFFPYHYCGIFTTLKYLLPFFINFCDTILIPLI